jgi:hypothetical protein
MRELTPAKCEQIAQARQAFIGWLTVICVLALILEAACL